MEKAQPNMRATTAAAIKRLFAEVRKMLTRRADAPAPTKSRRQRSGEQDQFIRKHLRRLFRKMARQTGDDGRDPPPSFDSQWWYWHQQHAASPGRDRHHGQDLRPPDYPSPTL